MNPIGRFFTWFTDFLNSLFPERSSEVLLQETIEGGDTAFRQSLDAIKASGGDIYVMMDELARQQTAARQAQSNVQQAVSAAQGLEGIKLQAANRRIAALQGIANTYNTVVAQIEQTIAQVKDTQENAEAGLVVSQAEQAQREAAARGNVVLERLYGTLERASDSQLRAAGFLKDPKIKDHSSELQTRASKARGRAESAQRITGQMLGNQAAAPLSAAESELLAQAYTASGVQPAATKADQSNQTAA